MNNNEIALDNLKNAYAPYSNFLVSSVLVCNDGTIFKGVNVENASYGGTICAERSAIVAAISNGYRLNDFKEIIIATNQESFVPPCFICRQTFTEFFTSEMNVTLVNINKEERKLKVSDFIINAFDKSFLL